MSNYIFTVADQDGISAWDKLRLRQKQDQFGLSESSPRRKSIRPGDRIIFYVAGPKGKVFAASATALSYADTYETGAIMPGDIYYTLELDDFVIWKQQVPIRPLLEELEFIKQTTNWGAYLQGGAIGISDKDYSRIMAEVA